MKTDNNNQIPDDWPNKIAGLGSYFNSIVIPIKPIQLNAFMIIVNVKSFIKNQIKVIKSRNGNQTFKPHLKRLQDPKQYLMMNQDWECDRQVPERDRQGRAP